MINGSQPEEPNLHQIHDLDGGAVVRSAASQVIFPLRILVHPITLNGIFAFLFCLAFFPFFRFNYSVDHPLKDSLIQGAPQILLAFVSLAVAALRLAFTWKNVLAALTAGLIGVSQAVGLVHNSAAQRNFVVPETFVMLLLVGTIFAALSSQLGAASRGEYVAKVVKAILVLLTVECVLRYAFSPFIEVGERLQRGGPATVDEGWIYPYKQSLIFSDSNSVGIALVCVIAVLLTFRQHFNRRHLIWAYCLTFAALSRASMIAVLVQFVIYKFWRWRGWIVGTIALLSPVVIYRLVLWYVGSEGNTPDTVDGSFLTKLMILGKMIDMYSQADLPQRLFGIGSGNLEFIAGIAAHNIVAVCVLELGIVASLMAIVYVWLLARGSAAAWFLLVVPVLINGFSLFLTTSPFFYVTLGFLGTVRATQLYSSGARATLPALSRT